MLRGGASTRKAVAGREAFAGGLFFYLECNVSWEGDLGPCDT
jgi:hypothetical protein